MSSPPLDREMLRLAAASLGRVPRFRPVIAEALVAELRRRFPEQDVDRLLAEHDFVVIPPLSKEAP